MRNTNYKAVLFPVNEKPVYFINKGKSEKVEGYKAIVGQFPDQKEKLFSLVTDNYTLVTNEQAIDLSKQIFKKLFDSANLEDFEFFNVLYPDSRSFCHIDIIHKNYKMNVFKREAYLPFIRISNSYNRKKALKFDIGFCRKLCLNGVIFEKATINYTFYHTKQSFKIDFVSDINIENLKKMEKNFSDYINTIFNFEVKKTFVVPLAAKALDKNFNIFTGNQSRKNSEEQKMWTFIDNINHLNKKYTKEFGDNAYAVFNAVTDFSSHYETAKLVSINSLQTKSGTWIEEFAAEIKKPGFNLENYLKDYLYIMN